ncbi:MAG: hypothetical protein U5M23_12625 [Marinagarivorans sp.]|nr:hypothetical protein [Marinagarivorans sp.]
MTMYVLVVMYVLVAMAMLEPYFIGHGATGVMACAFFDRSSEKRRADRVIDP